MGQSRGTVYTFLPFAIIYWVLSLGIDVLRPKGDPRGPSLATLRMVSRYPVHAGG